MSLRHFVNKWIMRLKESRTVLTIVIWGVMAITQVLGFARPYLTALELVALAGFMVFSGVAFTYLYDKLGIMKGENQQRVRRRDNFVGEQQVLAHLGMMHILSEAFDKDMDGMMNRYKEFLDDYQDGVDLRGDFD